MHVLAFADASFRDPHASYAVWLLHEDGRHVARRGRCALDVDNSCAAELYAVFVAVDLARSTWPETTRITVCSDCTAALDALTRPARNASMRLVQRQLDVVSAGVAIETRWVKGHQKPSSSAEAAINVWCDRMASVRGPAVTTRATLWEQTAFRRYRGPFRAERRRRRRH